MRRWARQLTARYAEVPALELVGAVANRVALALDAPGPAADVVSASLAAQVRREAAPPGGWGDPWLAGAVHEMAATADERRSRGAWYTPRPVAEGLVALALTADPTALMAPGGGEPLALPDVVVDPTCGGGGFLLAALDRLVALGLSPAEALGRVAGMDVDPDAVTVAGWSLALWWAARGGRGGGPIPPGPAPVADLVVGDALDPWPDRWRGRMLVVGNPPFATPLRSGALPEAANRYRQDRGWILGPYADLGAIHLLRAVEAVGSGGTGTVALVQPQSTLSGRDTEGLRSHLATRARLRALWAAREPVFDAGVRACAVVLDVTGEPGPGAFGGPDPSSGPESLSAVDSEVTGEPGPGVLVLAEGPAPRSAFGGDVAGGPEMGPVSGMGPVSRVEPVSGMVVLAEGPEVRVRGAGVPGPWGGLAADALGAPPLPAMGAWGTLGDLVSATAGFRDEHYALVAACREAEAGEEPAARLVTVGAVDPLWTAWGSRPLRFGGADRVRPVVDREALPPKIRAWLDRQLRPKVVLATQTRLLEPCVDRDGVIAPATPLIAVHAAAADLDRVAAVLLAPPVTAWAWRRWYGTAMAVDAVKLAARQVRELPLPPDRDAWEEASALIAGADGADRDHAGLVAVAVAELMTVAYGASTPVFDWWLARFRHGR